MQGSRRAGTLVQWRGAGRLDLGAEPPLVVGDKAPSALLARRAVSVRWLSGTVLTGVTSVFLMGGALIAALDGREQLAAPPDLLDTAASVDPASAGSGKADRMQPLKQQVASRQVVQVSTVTKEGDHSLIKLKPYAKISAPLSTKRNDLTAKIPPFNPLTIFGTTADDAAAAVASANADQIYGANVDGEVTVKTSDFPLAAPDLDATPAFKTAEIQDIVVQAAHLITGDSLAPAGTLAYADDPADGANADADSAPPAGVSITPENVTLVAKSVRTGAGAPGLNEKVAVLRQGETLAALLGRNEVGDDDAAGVTAAMGKLVDVPHLKGGTKVRFAFAPTDADGGTERPIRVSLYDGTTQAHLATVARTDKAGFIAADAPPPMPQLLADTATDAKTADSMPTVYTAVYQTALEQQVPQPLIDQLIKVFSYEVDYTSHISPGDSIEIFHSVPDNPGAVSPDDGILFASITLAGVKKRFYRYQTPDDNIVDYYDESGRSAKKFLIRKPMTEGVFASGFGYRKHPILGRVILHTGVDYAAPKGTPIMAAGNGIVERAGWSNGYGNFTLVRHTNGYETGYGHQSAFAKNLKPGDHVVQGQVIGYVGSTGLSTGPHLHFEIRINDKFVDPLRIRLPQGRILGSSILASFERERGRIDNLLNGGPGTAAPGKLAAAAVGG